LESGLAWSLCLCWGSCLVLFSVFGQGYGWGMMGSGMMGPGIMRNGWGFGLIGPIVLLVLAVPIIGGIAWVVQALVRSGSGPASRGGGESALDILKRRYAAGEITREQFDEMRRTLES